MKKIIRKLLILILLVVLGFSTYQLYKEFRTGQQEKEALEEVQTVVDVKNGQVTSAITKDKVLKLKEINSDIIGYLQFDSGIISEPVVQTSDNFYYLTRDVNKAYNDFGTVFMNDKNTLEDKNLILYGHSGSAYQSQKFSNLNDMVNNYDYYSKNSKFRLYTENDIREYEISYVIANSNPEAFNHQIQSFTEPEFNEWIAYAKQHTTVTPIQQIEYKDNFITLQTCLHGDDKTKVIVIAKEIGRTNYQQGE